MFSVISPIKLVQFWWNLAHSFLNKFATTDMNVFYLTWIMSLHYLVKLKMFITQVLPRALLQKETPEFIPYQLWPPNSPDLNPVDYSVMGIGPTAREGVQNMHHWAGWTETATENFPKVVYRHYSGEVTEVENVYMILRQICSGNYIPSFITVSRVL